MDCSDRDLTPFDESDRARGFPSRIDLSSDPIPRAEIVKAIGVLRRADPAVLHATHEADYEPADPLSKYAVLFGAPLDAVVAADAAATTVGAHGMRWQNFAGYAPADVTDDVLLVAWEAGLSAEDVWVQHEARGGLDIASLKALTALGGQRRPEGLRTGVGLCWFHAGPACPRGTALSRPGDQSEH